MNNALYNQIRIFQSIAREGNISAAARKSSKSRRRRSAMRSGCWRSILATPFCAHYPAYRADGNRATAAGADRRGGGDTGKVAGNHPRPESGALRGSENNPLALCLPAYSQTGDGGILSAISGGSSWKYRSMTVPSILLKNVSTLGSALAIFSKAAWSPAR